ncbi:hypothetical protein ACH41E_11410 [Streptomyces sp. NPDC020412]|uniref:hypothetical protein n=1 Tax=Streptomyces sp. NPDC020412 TaxID=3365073 RepID=UPI0037B37455
MSETRTDPPQTVQEDGVAASGAPAGEGAGKHRGRAAAEEAAGEPHGKHRRPGAE